MLQGTMTAMVTPFRSGRVDFDRLAENIHFQIESGVDALVPVGTTGESPTLSHGEHREVIEKVVEVANGEVTVVAGTGSNSTEEAIDLTAHAKKSGADAALIVSPYYNKPTQEGLYRHFATVADRIDLSIVLYNIPGRSGVTIEPKTIARLAEHENIVAVKEATGDLNLASQITAECDPQKLTIISGDDSLTLPLISIGAKGVISVLSNLIPGRIKAMTNAALAGQFDTARSMHLDLFALCDVMFIETNPIPIKTAMAMVGLDTGELRLPLCAMAEANRVRLEQVMAEHRLAASRT